MVVNSVAEIINDINKDLDNLANKIAFRVAQVAFNDLKLAHDAIMDSYYGGYTPVRYYDYTARDKNGVWYTKRTHGYRRTDNLRYNSITNIGVHKSGEHSFSAGVMIGSQAMDSYINSSGRIFPASGVFDLVWNDANRGLPPGYRGHVEIFNIDAHPVGISISGSPANAMDEFVEKWGIERGAQVADQVVGV